MNVYVQYKTPDRILVSGGTPHKHAFLQCVLVFNSYKVQKTLFGVVFMYASIKSYKTQTPEGNSKTTNISSCFARDDNVKTN